MTSYVDTTRFPGPDPYAPLGDLPAFPVRSSSFAEGEELAAQLQAPKNVSPHLAWDAADLPEGTRSIAITCLDPDAPTGSGYWHWAVFNIPVNVTEVAEGAATEDGLDGVPEARALCNDSGQPAYYGPQPPAGHGPHRYLFAVHAVDTEELDIPENATPTVLGFNLYFHSLARTITWGWAENK